jgi:hypothetical protein
MIIVSISIIYQVTIVLGNYNSLKFKVLMEGSNFQINFLEHPISENHYTIVNVKCKCKNWLD